MDHWHVGASYSLARAKLSQRLQRPRRGAFPLVERIIQTRALHALTSFAGAVQERIDRVGPGGRLRMLSFLLTAGAAGVCLRLCTLQTTEFAKWKQFADRQHSTSIKVPGARGTIFDRAGRSLAVSVKSFSLGVHPAALKDREQTLSVVAAVTGRPLEEVRERADTKKPFVWIAHGLPESIEEAVKRSGVTGVQLVPELRRYYPQGAILGPVLGRVGRDGEGLSGVERRFDAALRGQELRLAVRRDARGRLLNTIPLDDSQAEPGRILERVRSGEVLQALVRPLTDDLPLEDAIVRDEGGTVQLSIDAVIQSIVEDEMNRGEVDSKAKRVFGLVLDADTGEILALAQSSSFNPNTMDNVAPSDLKSAVLQDSFEPGSTLKPLVTAAALDARVIRSADRMDCENGQYRIGRHLIRDVHPQQVLDIGEVLVRSSNICMAKIGQRLGSTRLYRALKDFGFGEQTGIELPGEARGILRAVEDWSPVDEATHSFGQGVSVTALQMASGYAALANGGLLVPPTLLKRTPDDPPHVTRVLTQKTADAVRDMLRGVTEGEHGTGKLAAIPGLTVYGKTGTAQKARANGRGYDPDKILASFVGFVNGEEVGVRRRLVMYVGVDEPGCRPRWGGTLAAPIFRRSISRILSHLLTADPIQAVGPEGGDPEIIPAATSKGGPAKIASRAEHVLGAGSVQTALAEPGRVHVRS